MSIRNTIQLCTDFLECTETGPMHDALEIYDKAQVQDNMNALRYVANDIHRRVEQLAERFANDILAVSKEFRLDLRALAVEDVQSFEDVVVHFPELALEIAEFINRIMMVRLQARVLLQIQQHNTLRTIPGIVEILSQEYPGSNE